MEDDKICEVGHFLNFHFKPKLNVVQKKNRFYYTAYAHYSLNLIF